MFKFEEQFAWQERYIGTVVQLIAPHLITVSSPEVDKNKNGDLEIAFPRNGTVAVRLRTQKYAQYAGEVTFRSRSKHNGKTEISKIIDGYGDYFFYGHVGSENIIWYWHLLSLNEVRASFTRNSSMLLRSQMPNGDGTWFLPFKVERDFPRAVIAHHDSREIAA